jgi:cobalt-zinc-cadmium resistance protein CzcA
VLRRVPGAADVKVEQVTGLPTLTVEIDRTAASRFGLNVADIQAVVRTALAGSEVGAVYEGDRRFDIVVRLPESVRNDLHALERLPVPVDHTGGGVEFVPLDAVAAIKLSEGPNQVSREDGKRRVVVQANVRGGTWAASCPRPRRRSRAGSRPAGLVADVGRAVREPGDGAHPAARGRAVRAPAHLRAAVRRLRLALGRAAGLQRRAAGADRRRLRARVARLPFSITAGVGFIALSGVAVLNGVMMLSFVRTSGRAGSASTRRSSRARRRALRPVLMTALVASLGFVPMALASGTGAEVQRPLATVVIGGSCRRPCSRCSCCRRCTASRMEGECRIRRHPGRDVPSLQGRRPPLVRTGSRA